MQGVKIFDTTLRDGAQTPGITLSVWDKMRIAQKLVELDIHYIEGGWPGSNKKDSEFFARASEIKWGRTKLVAFGSTRRKNLSISKDPFISTLINSNPSAFCIFGKSWDRHVKNALRATLDENLKMIADTISYLKKTGKEVIYDAEHFFDGFKSNPNYALKTLKTAEDAGADWIVLCDTNGGMLPFQIGSIIAKIRRKIKTPIGIHCHNDSGCAIANSLEAVRAGATMIQGTMNGYGERCGNADLSSILPNLIFKMSIPTISEEKLKYLTEVSHYISEICNLKPNENQPFVGNHAFTHKGGVHAQAQIRDNGSYEHIDPKKVGNTTKIIISDLAGKAAIIEKAKTFGFNLENDLENVSKILKEIERLSAKGYEFETADGSFALLVMKVLGIYKPVFANLSYKVVIETKNSNPLNKATVKVSTNGKKKTETATGEGPVNALDNALQKAIKEDYPEIKNIKLIDYKVHLQKTEGTASVVIVNILSSDKEDTWGTIGVSENIIDASFKALIDSIEYGLLKNQLTKEN